MEIELTHAQLVDETAPTIDQLRKNIRMARLLALQMDRPACRYDHALNALAELEAELKVLAEEAIEDIETAGEIEITVW